MPNREIVIVTQRGENSISGAGGVVNMVKKLVQDPDVYCYHNTGEPIDFIHKIREKHPYAIWVTMDPQMGYALKEEGIPYHLVYHQQGGILYEATAYDSCKVKSDEKIFKKVESAIWASLSLATPSFGGKEALYTTTDQTHRCYYNNPLYNTVIEDPTPMAPETEEALATIRNYIKSPIILTIGQFIDPKGLDRIPNILQNVTEPYTWIVIGDGKLFEKVAYGAPDNWIAIKKLSHRGVLSLMNDAKIYLGAHRYSINDIATLEAQKARVPLVLSNVRGNDEFDSALLWNNYEEASTMINKLLSNEVYYSAVQNQLKRDDQRFSNEAFVQRYTDYFEFVRNHKGV